MRHRAATASARVLLWSWLGRSHTTARALAATLNITPAYMSQVLHGDRRPSVELLLLIEVHTGVPVTAWVEKPVATLGKAANG